MKIQSIKVSVFWHFLHNEANKTLCEGDYAWNPITRVQDYDKDCDSGEFLKDCKCMKSFVDYPVVRCTEIENTRKNALIKPNDKTNYLFISLLFNYQSRVYYCLCSLI